ncbi:MAG: CDP-alcohol phosphatidyltransferase family protein [Desulfurellaceae bacterium]|nr:CDP-alcohol phosphatidyltransferase family protein [Desulfurellaceae bacterium]
MRIWIDATNPMSALRLFGMTLLERQLHTLLEAGLEPAEVYVQLAAETTNLPALLPAPLLRRLPLQWGHDSRTLGEYRTSLPPDAHADPLLALEADAVIDSRLLHHLAGLSGSWIARGEAEQTAVLRLEGDGSPLNSIDVSACSLPELAEKILRQGSVQELHLSEVPSHIRKLRRDLPVYLFCVADPASRDRAERFLFWSNYKGSTDFFTKYVYPPLVWRAVRPLARWRVHPNVISLFNVGITFLAVPLFAQSYWLTGFTLAYTMSVLDSVDGKLARLTFRASTLGNILDHGLDIIHPPVWYFAWAWALGAGDITAPVMQLAVWMAVFYVLDRIVAALFSARVGRSIHGCTPFDERMRTWISRRNINVPFFMVGLLLGLPVAAFSVIVVWQVVSLGLHALRLVQFWNRKERARGAE